MLEVSTSETLTAGLHNLFPTPADANAGALLAVNQDLRVPIPGPFIVFYVSCLSIQELSLLLCFWLGGQAFSSRRRCHGRNRMGSSQR